MLQIKHTKAELKKQRDALTRYRRYLPILQIKKQQLQIEILHQLAILEEKKNKVVIKLRTMESWAGLLSDQGINLWQWIKLKGIITQTTNIAGIELAVFKGAEFDILEYDLFTTPLWVDAAIESFKELISLRKEIDVMEKNINILRYELRITTQRVNLFEKVKIPEAEKAIHLIKIYLGDQMTNAVGRSKIAKRKLEALVLEEVAV